MNKLNKENKLEQPETVPEGNQLHHYFHCLDTNKSTCLELPSTTKILGCVMDIESNVCAIVAAESEPEEPQEIVLWQVKCHRLKHVTDSYTLRLCAGAHVYFVQAAQSAYLVTLERSGIPAPRVFKLFKNCQSIEADMKYLASGHDSEQRFHVFEFLWQSRK